ncbi:MAG TPA: cytochrome P450 [Nannocystis sp.]|jgi:cytochrome P450
MQLPPGPRAPSIVQTVQFLGRPTEFLTRCRARFGPIFTIRLAGMPAMVCVGDAEGIAAIYRAPRGRFSVGSEDNALLPIVGRDSLLVLDGERHHRARKLLTPPFTGERMRAYGDIIAAATRRAAAHWRAGAEVVAHDATQTLTQEVILRAVFGIADDRLDAAMTVVREAVRTFASPVVLFEGLRRRLGLGSSPTLRRQRAALDRVSDSEIARHRGGEATDGEDILSRMLQARDESGAAMTDAELRDELCTTLFAGQKSTAIALSWALHWVLRTPGVLASVRAELDAAGDIGADASSRLPYLSAVCDETLRVLPVFPVVAWILDEPMEILGVPLAPGTRVAPGIYLVHRDARAYPEPEVFRPERFLQARRPGPFEYIPFGGGPRRCLGAAFALYEMKIALATLLRSFELELVDPRTRIALQGLMLAPADGVRLRVRATRGSPQSSPVL